MLVTVKTQGVVVEATVTVGVVLWMVLATVLVTVKTQGVVVDATVTDGVVL